MTKPDLLRQALARLILRHPFLATLALRLERVEDSAAGTAWTDGVRLAVAPAWFAGLSDNHRLTLVAHECYHVALAHHLRRGGRDLTRWNLACDYAVNALLLADGFALPADALHDPAYGDASAEAIYNRLRPEPEETSGAGAAPPAIGPGIPATPPPPAGANPPPPPGAGGASSPPGDPNHPGAASTPAPAPAASGPAPSPPAPAPPPPSHRPGSFGEVRDQPSPAPPSPAQQQVRLAQHAVLVTALAQQARAAGQESAGARRAATAATAAATIDWRALLVEFLTARHEQDYSWRRPNPRYALLGLFLPLLEAAAPGRVGFVVDTSGSVPRAALDAVTAELEAYLRQYPATTLEVLYADAEVTGRTTYTAADLPLRLEPVGGGGTAFGPALAALTAGDELPACAVYLTDLDGSFPGEAPPMPVIWLVFGQPLAMPVAPFGKVVMLPY